MPHEIVHTSSSTARHTHLGHGVHLDTGTINLDLVGVHRRVGHQDLGVFDALGLPHADLLVQDKALVQKRFTQRPTGLFDDVDGLQVARALEAKDGVHRQLGKVVLVTSQDLRRCT